MTDETRHEATVWVDRGVDKVLCHNPLPVWDVPVGALRAEEGTAAIYVSQVGNKTLTLK